MPRSKVSDVLRMRVRHLLFSSGRKQTELAEYLKVTDGNVSQMLNGLRGIDLDHLDRIAQFFGVAVAELFMIDGEKFRERRLGKPDRRSGEDRRGQIPDRREG